MKTRIALSMIITAALLCCMGCATVAPSKNLAQQPQAFKQKITKTVQSKYLLYLPEGYATSQEDWPLILFLHGAGERGANLDKVKMHGPPKLIEEGKSFPFVIVSPQCPLLGWWPSVEQTDTLAALIDHITDTYRIDEDRIYVTGLSMGGFGTWRLAFEYPFRFAAIAPICGRGEPFAARAIPHLPVWVFHGAKDDTVPLQASQEMVDALNKVKGNVKFTIYPEAGHDSWTETYNNPELYEWFLQHKRAEKKSK